MNYIVFTQDISGERKWLENQFQNCQNFETIYSGLWPADYPIQQSVDSLWEVPPDFTKDVSTWHGKKLKSLYDIDRLEITNRWMDADDLLLNSVDFDHAPRADKALVLHLARSGTMLLENILKNHCCYEQISDWGGKVSVLKPNGFVEVTRTHDSPYAPTYVSKDGQSLGEIQYNIIRAHRPDIFFIYRADWWEWITSNVIAEHKGYFHYDTAPDLSSTSLITIMEEDLVQLKNQVKYVFNNLCHMRTVFRNINFYIFEYNDLIKNQSLGDHKKIPYDKKSLFTNYDQMQKIFEEKYLETLNLWRDRFVNHVGKMKCHTPTNFDKIYSSTKHA